MESLLRTGAVLVLGGLRRFESKRQDYDEIDKPDRDKKKRG